MKKYKLLKNIPQNHAGAIYQKDKYGDKPDYYSSSETYSVGSCIHASFVENNPYWFEEIKEHEFEKLFIATVDRNKDYYDLSETFETEKQLIAECALREHIYKFKEPDKANDYYLLDDNGLSIEFEMYEIYMEEIGDRQKYKAGLIMNKETTKKDRKERIKLIKEANQF